MNEAKVLLVDDDDDVLTLLSIRLRRAGFQVETADSGATALTLLKRFQPQVIVSDLRMQGMDGLALLVEIERRYPVLPVILLTAHGTIPDAVAATRKGAFAFLTKPINSSELIARLREAVALQGGAGETGGEAGSWRANILTRSSLMEAVLQQARLAAVSDVSIIIQSESGTGKELLAQAIHASSSRASGPFVPVNCAAIPGNLFESELFGHTKGAFTGASRTRMGLFQQARGGTLFLDEIGDMPLESQVKVLRALQEGIVRPVGSDQALEVDVRVVAATHHNLAEAVSEGRFREDLFYRLNVVMLELPPLSRRREDIPLLANHFLAKYQDMGVAGGFSADAMERLLAAPWPGNIRQLANVVQQCKVLSRSDLIPASLVEHALREKFEKLVPFAAARDRFEADYLSSLLQATNGNVTQAARLAERNRSEFYKLLKKHNLDPAVFRQNEADPD